MPDVNILAYAHRPDDPQHVPYVRWFEQLLDGPSPFALSTLVAVGFVQVVTNRRIYKEDPTPLPLALAVIESIASHPRCRLAVPSPDHLTNVVRLARATGVTGDLVADAQHAALAIAQGCTWVTRDADFGRFAPHGLRWQHLVLE